MTSLASRARTAIVAIIRRAVWLLDTLVPAGGSTVLRTFPSVEDSGRALWEAMSDAERRSFVWLVDDPAAVPASAPAGPRYVKVASAAGWWAYLRASRVLHTHGVYSLIKPAAGKLAVNIWHGMRIKHLGSGGPAWEWQTDATLVTSPVHAPNLAAVWNLEDEQLWVTGLPRNDVLVRAAAQPRPEGLRRVAADRPLAVWLPTYRTSAVGRDQVDGADAGNVFQFAGAEPTHVDQLAADLGVHVIVKPHPMAPRPDVTNLEHVSVWTDADVAGAGMSLYELLGHADVLVTDYSSVWVDYLLADRPIIFAVSDLAQYRANRGYYFEPLEDYLPGSIVTDLQEFTEVLREVSHGRDVGSDVRREAIALHHTHRDDQSARRVLDRSRR